MQLASTRNLTRSWNYHLRHVVREIELYLSFVFGLLLPRFVSVGSLGDLTLDGVNV